MKNTGYPSIDRRHEDGSKFFERNPIIPDMSIYNALKLMSITNRDGYAIDCNNVRITYQELLDNIKIISKAFKELGVKEKDIICVSTPNIGQALGAFFAANRIGAIVSNLGANPSDVELIEYLNKFESPLLINFNKSEDFNNRILNKTKVRNIITVTTRDLNRKTFSDTTGIVGYNPNIKYDELKVISEFYKQRIKTNFGGKYDAQILFTSGSTGKPKSIVLTNHNIMSSAIYMKNSTRVPLVKGEKCLVTVSFKVPYGFDTSAIMTLLCGKEAILAPDLSADNIHKYLAKKPNYIFGAEPVYDIMTSSSEVDKMDLNGIEVAIWGGSYLSPNKNAELVEYFRRHNSNAFVYNGSGNGETAGANTNAVGLEIYPETVGKPLVGTNVMIINPETGEELKYGESGILCISGGHVFSRYYQDEESTKEVKFTDKKGTVWYRTDTYAKMLDNGYLQITGRGRDTFITLDENGDIFKVDCNHVRDVISSIPYIKDCYVMAISDTKRAKVGRAFIVIKEEYKNMPNIYELILKAVSEPVNLKGTNTVVQLKDAEIPKYFEEIENIPYMESDKVDYVNLANGSYTKKRIR